MPVLHEWKDWIVLVSMVAIAINRWVYSLRGAPSLEVRIGRLKERADEFDRHSAELAATFERRCSDAVTRFSGKADDLQKKIGTVTTDIAVMQTKAEEHRRDLGRLEEGQKDLWKAISQRFPTREEH